MKCVTATISISTLRHISLIRDKRSNSTVVYNVIHCRQSCCWLADIIWHTEAYETLLTVATEGRRR